MESGTAGLRDNADWIAGLKAGRSEVTAALRARIRQGLGAALSDHPDVGEADLDDFTQDAVLRVLERLDSFRGDSSFTTWAMAVAVRVSLTALRRRRWTATPLDELLADPATLRSFSKAGSVPGARGELFALLRSAIAEELTPRQRQVLLAELDGVPQVVLAERLSSTPGAIYKTSHDARKKLKSVLTRVGFDAQTVKETLANDA